MTAVPKEAVNRKRWWGVSSSIATGDVGATLVVVTTPCVVVTTPCVVVCTFRAIVSATLRVTVVRRGTLFGIHLATLHCCPIPITTATHDLTTPNRSSLVIVIIHDWERSRLLVPRESTAATTTTTAAVPIESCEVSCRRRCILLFGFLLSTEHGVEGHTKGNYKEYRHTMHSYDRHRRLTLLAWFGRVLGRFLERKKRGWMTLCGGTKEMRMTQCRSEVFHDR